MCWKYQWAHAIDKCEKAIAHIEYAHKKLIKRRERNQKAIQTDATKKLIAKNTKGIKECEVAIQSLRQTQDLLFRMVHEYGISHVTYQRHAPDKLKRVYKYMGKYYIEGKEKDLI